jgi:uncharacterized protein YqgC (DUF456 family)
MIALIILAFICLIVGIIGCIVPGSAGPPFSYSSLILLSIAKRWQPFSAKFLIIMAAITVFVTGLDYLLPAAAAKKYGASRLGFWGAIIGMIFGILFFPPLGMIIGAFLGAIVGELLKGKQSYEALKAGWGVFMGVVLAVLLKLIASGIMTFYFIKALI